MAPQRRIVQESVFVSALAALECPRARWMMDELAAVLIAYPHCAPVKRKGSACNVLHTEAYEEFPALRLFYRLEDDALYLLDVEVYDPLVEDRTKAV